MDWVVSGHEQGKHDIVIILYQSGRWGRGSRALKAPRELVWVPKGRSLPCKTTTSQPVSPMRTH